MAQFYEMPAVSPTMEFGTLVSWKLKEGQKFASGAVVAEVGTDKANMDAEIFDAGVLIKQLVAEGDEIPPGYPIAIWGKSADEDVTALLASFAGIKASKAAPAAAAQAPATSTPAEAAPSAPVATPTPAPAPTPVAAPSAATDTVRREWMGKTTHGLFFEPPGDLGFGAAKARVAASPLARKIADERGVDLRRVQGTGPGGRIVKADVEGAPTGGPAPAAAATRDDAVLRNSPMRKTIAKRLLASHTDIPTFFLTATFDMAGFLGVRAQLKARAPDLKISYNDILLAAVARSLVDHPEVNASWGPDAITRHGRVDLGVAVAVEGGLITPVVRNADQKGLATLASEVRDLADRARAQKLMPEEYTGGTFTISNLGMMQIEHFTAIINPPEAAILAVGAITEEPVVVDGALTVGHRMKVTMTCDHRVIDGAVGAAFLQTLRRYVEAPYLLLV